MDSAVNSPSVDRASRIRNRRLFVATMASWLLVMAGAVAALRVADALPAAALGMPRGVRRFATLGDLQRTAGRRMPIPAYYPQTIEWPPSEQRFFPGGSAAIWCRQRSDGVPWLVIATAPTRPGVVAPQVLPASADLQRSDGALRGRPAVLSRIRSSDGALWQQIEWQGPHGIVLVRYRGTLDELMKIAGSMYE